MVVVVTPDTKNFAFLFSSDKILALLLVGKMSDFDKMPTDVPLSLLACFPASVRTTWRVKVGAV